MSFKAIRSQIQTKLEAITNIQQVLNYPAKPDQFPGATVTPSGAASDYETNTDNQRTYAFIIRLFYETKSGGTSNAVNALEGLVDEVVDAFDSDTQLTGITMPANYILIQSTPTPSAWEYFTEENIIMAEIRIAVLVSFDIT